jgi:hypothetical protein
MATNETKGSAIMIFTFADNDQASAQPRNGRQCPQTLAFFPGEFPILRVWERGYPLLRELADRPNDWLELSGAGRVTLAKLR